MDLSASQRKVEALVNPRNVVLVGASDRPGSWAARTWVSLKKYGFPGCLYQVNPRRDQLFGETCYPNLAALPEPPDHLVLVVPAKAVAEMLRAGAQAGARSATILSSGFEETGSEEGKSLARELAIVIAETGMAVSGPNCLGNICVKHRLATLSQDAELMMQTGPVALVGQSGGVAIFVNRALQERCIRAGYIISTGNETGLSIADYIAYFATEPEVRVILCYSEGIKDSGRFRAACALARSADKSIVVFKSGQSDAGKKAALAHTGSLAGNIEVFDALAADLGVIRVDTFDDAIEVTELLTHARAPAGRRLAAVSLSGAYCGMLLDAAAKNGLGFPPLATETTDKLRTLLSVGAAIGNPLDGGFGVLTSEDIYAACVAALEADPNIDALVIQEELPREPGGDRRGERYLRRIDRFVATTARKPVIYTTILSHGQSDYSRTLRSELPHLTFLQEANKSLRAINLVIRRNELEALAQGHTPTARISSDAASLVDLARAAAKGANGKPVALNEVESKRLLRAFGVRTTDEEQVATPEQAVAAATRIGYPVVLKAVSCALTHKSEMGAVRLNLASGEDVRAAYAHILRNLQAHGFGGPIEGMLVSRHVQGGIEMVLGVHRDPELGLAVMCGSGGILLELVKDVAFAVPPLDARKAEHLIRRTKTFRLLAGYRGGREHDVAAVIEALEGLGRLAEAFGDALESIDVNPFLCRPKGEGGIALDALVVVRSRTGGEARSRDRESPT